MARNRIAADMKKDWRKRAAVFGCALLALSVIRAKATAQAQEEQSSHQQSQDLSLEGPAIHMLVTSRIPKRELHKLVTKVRTAQQHPDLADFYRSEAHRLQTESATYERFARTAGDKAPLDAPNHFGISRTARFDYLVAKDKQKRAQDDNILAALDDQAERREGCFKCHSLNGHGGKAAPDLAMERTRGRSDVWLIGHFKEPQNRSQRSIMPSFSSLTDRQLKTLTVFLQSQRGK